MGFLATFNRQMYLTAYVNNLQSQLNDITAQKLSLTEDITKVISSINDLANPDSPAVKKLEARKVELEHLDKKLDIEMQKIQTKLQAATTEMQSGQQALQQNVQRSFTYNLGS